MKDSSLLPHRKAAREGATTVFARQCEASVLEPACSADLEGTAGVEAHIGEYVSVFAWEASASVRGALWAAAVPGGGPQEEELGMEQCANEPEELEVSKSTSRLFNIDSDGIDHLRIVARSQYWTLAHEDLVIVTLKSLRQYFVTMACASVAVKVQANNLV